MELLSDVPREIEEIEALMKEDYEPQWDTPKPSGSSSGSRSQ
ncbi:hypothetical protein SARC_15794 [Sphaeroforma arctica JP610]|uniref:Uncharacterized protein n=1 Tax=Sphaeroforma arctica JP610 TaxID=667725 RepID=A0A0L0F691_9EUKA|nr:hypothetical protein SARC_15794 [Sphaeroforma arctica JP610]KNC71668.1 hypothetical protein SARC_15794 [Sphaeroforma arctica JP610]|eukprot:XP_014145570.1 hypothetical protein SARC_15794 [Sphaeroforma arctica JP610]